MSTDRIEKQIELKAPVSRVWRALTDHREFGQWFRATLEQPFVPGERSRGNMTYPGYEHLKLVMIVEKMEPERHFSFFWHPFEIDPAKEGTAEELLNRVEFRLEKTSTGTLLRLTESGFDKLPADRREAAFRSNDGGWSEQMQNIEKHVSATP